MLTILIAILSFFPPLVVLAKQLKAELMVNVCFVLATYAAYRTCDATQIELIMPRPSVHKLFNIFVIIQSAQLVVYLARLTSSAGSLHMSLLTGLTLVLQEKDIEGCHFSIFAILVNNTVLIYNNYRFKPDNLNPDMVRNGVFWYCVALIGFA